jgi:hypothetical protein
MDTLTGVPLGSDREAFPNAPIAYLTHRRLQSSCSGHKRQRFTETDELLTLGIGSVSTKEKLRTSGHHTSFNFS